MSACQPPPVTYTPDPSQTQLISSGTAQPTTLPLPYTPTPLPPYHVWIDPDLPPGIGIAINQNPDLIPAETQPQAQLSIASSGKYLIGHWTYLMVGPFNSLLDDITFADLYTLWSSGPQNQIPVKHLYLTEETLRHLSGVWEAPEPSAITTVLNSEITNLIWEEPDSFALIPFEKITASHKVISIDQYHPFEIKDYSTPYQLSIPLYYTNNSVSIPEPFSYFTNFDPGKMTSVALTGVTALARHTALIMERQGILYPAKDVQSILSSADITHINNEVPFMIDCPYPEITQDSLSFCSNDRYIELIKYVGADIVELSGDHFADKGTLAVEHTLDLYRENDLLVYGGGINLAAGLEPVLFVHNGNHIAFIGCNAKAKGLYATATDTRPGAAECDFEWMNNKIAELIADGYLVIATMQHEEVDSFLPISLQSFDFRNLIEAGATIVSGSQAHHPQGFELDDEHFVHYGLGNLFFDQWWLTLVEPEIHINKDKSFIDIHYFYNNRYINTLLIPLQFIDNARPRPMTPEEKIDFMNQVFNASKWNDRWLYLYPSYY